MADWQSKGSNMNKYNFYAVRIQLIEFKLQGIYDNSISDSTRFSID